MTLGQASGELIEAESELVILAVGQQVLPGDFALLVTGHAAQHATERGLHAGGDLVVRRSRDDAVDESALLVAVGEFQVVEKRAVGRELARAGRCGSGILPCPGLASP